MAQPDIIRGTYFALMLGDGNVDPGPEVFTALCGITTRSFTQQLNTNDQFTRDCADPENVPVRRLIPTGEQWDLSGEGSLNRAQLADIQAAYKQRENWRFVFTEPTDDEVYQGHYTGPAILTNITITGGDEEYATISVTIGSDGAWAWTTVTPV